MGAVNLTEMLSKYPDKEPKESQASTNETFEPNTGTPVSSEKEPDTEEFPMIIPSTVVTEEIEEIKVQEDVLELEPVEVEENELDIQDGKLVSISNLPHGYVLWPCSGPPKMVRRSIWGCHLVDAEKSDGIDLSKVSNSFYPNPDTPKIPPILWAAILNLYFSVKEGLLGQKSEVAVVLMRSMDPPHSEWKVVVPTQKVSAGGVDATYADQVNNKGEVITHATCFDILTGEQYPSIADVPGFTYAGTSHSHHTLGTYFSGIDDANELKNPGLHIVVGDMPHKDGERTCRVLASYTQMKRRYTLTDFEDIIDWDQTVQAPLLVDTIKKFVELSSHVKNSEFSNYQTSFTPNNSSYSRNVYGDDNWAWGGHGGWDNGYQGRHPVHPSQYNPGQYNHTPTNTSNKEETKGPFPEQAPPSQWWNYNYEKAKFRRVQNGLWLPISEVGDTDDGSKPWNHTEVRPADNSGPVGFQPPAIPATTPAPSSNSLTPTSTGPTNNPQENKKTTLVVAGNSPRLDILTIKDLLKQITSQSLFRKLPVSKRRRLSSFRDLLGSILWAEDVEEEHWLSELLAKAGFFRLSVMEKDLVEKVRKNLRK